MKQSANEVEQESRERCLCTPPGFPEQAVLLAPCTDNGEGHWVHKKVALSGAVPLPQGSCSNGAGEERCCQPWYPIEHCEPEP